MDYKNLTVLITGGTGTVGRAMIKHLLSSEVKKIIIVSREQSPQNLLRKEILKEYGIIALNRVEFILCDIRNNKAFQRCFINCDIVIHAAALKYIDICEKEIEEAYSINVIGTLNVVKNTINNNVKKAILISSDKACSPNSVYGSTKLIAERLFLNANCETSKFSVLRCGNISGSNGSVVPYFKKLVEQGKKTLPVTHQDMCRFWIGPYDVAKSIEYALNYMVGGEVFVPKMPSFKIVDLAKAISGQNEVEIVGLRKGEKIEESILNSDLKIYENNTMYVEWNKDEIDYSNLNSNFKISNSPTYTTKNNSDWLTIADLVERLKKD